MLKPTSTLPWVALALFFAVCARAEDRSAETVTLTVIGTNDFHGRLERLPWLSGHLNNLRREMAKNPRHVMLLVDAGDMFQGTLESNLNEGAAVINAYNAMGYDAVTIGNHEFDFGPVGPRTTVQHSDDDPRGALRARARQAHFPFLAANTIDTATGRAPDWDNVYPSVIVQKRGLKIGIVGVTTAETAKSTVAANVRGLRFTPLAGAVKEQALALRHRGAAVVIVLAHEGGMCRKVTDSMDVSSCDLKAPIVRLAKALPPGLINLIVAGHTHQAMAHVIHGIPIIESMANGQAFGQINFTINPGSQQIDSMHIVPTRQICREAAADPCSPEMYAGAKVMADRRIAKVIQPALDAAKMRKEAPLNVELKTTLRRSYSSESALGNVFSSLMLNAYPKADVAILNAGALRVNLKKGPLTYGQLYEVHPFDNNFALITLTGAQLRAIAKRNLQSRGGFLSMAGIHIHAACRETDLDIVMARERGGTIEDTDIITVVTSDFLATGGDDVFQSKRLPKGALTFEEANIRDTIARDLSRPGATLGGDSKQIRRWDYPGRRPVRCPP